MADTLAVTSGNKDDRVSRSTSRASRNRSTAARRDWLETVEFFFQSIQLGILKNLPPISFLRLVARLRRLPVGILLVRRRNLRRGL